MKRWIGFLGIAIFLILPIFAGCGNKVEKVSVYDESTAEEGRKELNRLEKKFKDMDRYDAADPEYQRYVGLWSQYGISPYGNYGKKFPNFSGSVDLKNLQILLDNQTKIIIFRENQQGDYEIVKYKGDIKEGDVDERTLLAMIRQADKQTQERHQALISKLMKTLWLPILLYIYGLIALVAPEKIWYLSHGRYYKNSEPSDSALFWNKAGGVWSMIMATIILILII